MTDSVIKISKAQDTERKTARSLPVPGKRPNHHPDEPADDSIDISEEARDRASGRRRKTILEYLEDEEG